MAQPLSASSRPKNSIMKVANWACSSGEAALPAPARAKIAAAVFVEAEVGVTLVQAVVGKPAALRVKIIVAAAQGLEERCEVSDVHVGGVLRGA